MKKFLIFLWLMLPLPVVVWHYGPGQKWLARDQAHALIRKAEAFETQKNWREAEVLFREAAERVRGVDDRLQTQLDIALVRARYRQGSAVEAIDMADRLVNDPKFQRQPDELQREARELASRIHYHAAWVMRLEGAQKDLWMEEAELARQNFRMLSEETLSAGRTNYSQLQQTNLESSVRLQRMGLVELMAKPLPEEGQAMAGQGLTEQMARRRGQRGKGNQPGIGEDNDSRQPQAGASNNRFQGGPGS
jgi:hypothetical protein